MNSYLPIKFWLRWSFEYLNGRQAYGMWLQDGEETDVANKASCQDRTGLLYACVEARNVETREVKAVVRCPKADYIMHRWIYCAPVPNPIGLVGAVTLYKKVIQGLTIVTRDEKIHVYVDGTLTREPMTEPRSTYG